MDKSVEKLISEGEYDKAKEIATTANQEIIRFEKMLVEDIPEEDLEVFFRVTKQIRNNLEKNFKD